MIFDGSSFWPASHLETDEKLPCDFSDFPIIRFVFVRRLGERCDSDCLHEHAEQPEDEELYRHLLTPANRGARKRRQGLY